MSVTSRLLIQVLPRLLPGRCGLSDQAAPLAAELNSAFSIDSAFAVLNSNERSSLPYPQVYCSPSRLLEACLSLAGGRPGAILVHMNGYGYSADGAPTLLAEALEAVRASGRFQIAVYFHDLYYAKATPWKKAFWYSRRQRKAVLRIAELGDLLVTSTRHQADWLERVPGRRSQSPVRLLRVISGAGEALQPAPPANREPVLAVFGLAGSRQRAYKQLSATAAMLETLGIREIVDIGQPFDAPATLGGIPVRRIGIQPAERLASLFSRMTFGFVPHAPHALAKSSVFASYCAQGTIPVLAESFAGEIDGLIDGVHLVSPGTAGAVQGCGLERYSLAAWNWYSAHRVRVHAELYAAWLREHAPLCEPHKSAAAGASAG